MKTEKAKKIRLLAVDVDGVLTDGSIGYGNFGDTYRVFNVQDGFGFVLLHKAGLKSAIISGKSSRGLRQRSKEMKIAVVCQNAADKMKVFRKLLKKFKLKPEEVCYIGDDLLDLAVLKSSGLSVTVPQACGDVRQVVDYVTQKDAGKGAVRETIELILKAQGKWDNIVRYYSPHLLS
jgi:3-deoxy-D-manno-octulosonate 8-phosphate phosphatase (KDO 8-P phosphatase)